MEKEKQLLDEYMLDSNVATRSKNILNLIAGQKKEEQLELWQHFFQNCEPIEIKKFQEDIIVVDCPGKKFNNLRALKAAELASAWILSCLMSKRDLKEIAISFMELLNRQTYDSKLVILAFVICSDFIPFK
jgi:hypothetical protein